MLFGLLFFVAACDSPVESEAETLLIAAAASLEQVLEGEIIPLFAAAHEHIAVRGTYGGSFHLTTQIELGLGADLFFFAAMSPVEQLYEQGLLVADTVTPLLENTLVLITPLDMDTSVTGFSDILAAQTIAIGDPGSVPAGRYAQAVFAYLGIWDAVHQRASLGNSVSTVLRWVATGNAEVGVVYVTDAFLSPYVRVIAEAPPESLHTPILYPVGMLAGSQNTAAALSFLEFLQSPEVLAIFQARGFLIA